MRERTFRCVGILLAAGRGTRFDPTGRHNKLLADCGGGPVVAEAARHLLNALPEVIAVVGASDHETAGVLDAIGCRVSFSKDSDQGMSATLRHGLALATDAQGWVIALGDMPYVQPATIRALADTLATGADIAAPVIKGRRGNPVAFSHAHLRALLRVSGDQGARSLLASYPVTQVPVDDPGIFLDIDTPADLGAPLGETI